jgi:hypothetical protein
MGAHFFPSTLTVLHRDHSNNVHLIGVQRSNQVQVKLRIDIVVIKCGLIIRHSF